MKKLLVLIIGILILFSTGTDAQCKFKPIKKYYLKSAQSPDCSISPDISTKLKKIVNKPMEMSAQVSFAKSGEEYYLYFYIDRQSSSKFEIHTNNSLVLMMDGYDPISLLPCGDVEPRAMPLLDCHIGCFYHISREQLKQIADSGKLNSFFLHVSADKEIPSAMIDEDGSMFFEYEIISDALSDNISHSASCILTK